eukprot:8622530-Ditylum_brightwellii.AAC.1
MLLNMWFGLEWEVIESNTSVDSMDLTISLKNGKIQTTLFEKSLNLYLYIPPHSAHTRCAKWYHHWPDPSDFYPLFRTT